MNHLNFYFLALLLLIVTFNIFPGTCDIGLNNISIESETRLSLFPFGAGRWLFWLSIRLIPNRCEVRILSKASNVKIRSNVTFHIPDLIKGQCLHKKDLQTERTSN